MGTSKHFLPPAAFHGEASARYHLLPFRFHAISDTREVLTNEVGDFLLCPRGTAKRVVEREVQADEPLYADLVANFFISPTPEPALMEVLATRYRTKKSFLDSFTALHIVVVTLRCNHTCHYCQVSRQTADRHQFDISESTLDSALELIFQAPSNELTIEFQGGEPFLAFDKIRYAVAAAHRLNVSAGKTLRFVACTNLTVLNDEMLSYCREHDIVISTSLDGPAEIHDRNRPISGTPSSELFRRGLARAREIVGVDRVSALMTTSRLSLDDPIAIVDCYRENAFDHIFLRPIHPYGFARKLAGRLSYEPATFLTFYKAALKYILDLNRRGEWFVEDFAAIILKKILTPFPVGYVDLQSPSGLANGVVVYNYDGGVYASDESRMLAETGDRHFRLGSVTDTYAALFCGPKAEGFTASSVIESLAGCADCGFQPYCGSDPVQNHALTGDIEGYRPTSPFCTVNMETIRFLFEIMDTDPEAAQIFRRWSAA